MLFRVYCGAAFPLFELRRAQRSKSETTGKRGCGTEAAPAVTRPRGWSSVSISATTTEWEYSTCRLNSTFRTADRARRSGGAAGEQRYTATLCLSG